MMRKLVALWLAACLAFLPLESFGVLKGSGGAIGNANITSGTIAGATITNSIGATNVLAASGIGIGIAPTGTMGNNGAITLGTALDRTYSEGLYLCLPAGAVAAGVPAAAACLWTVMSSGTGGTVFNSAYTTGVPVAGTQTAFVTTGPGAYTGSTSEVFITIPVAANAMGAMGILDAEAQWRNNNTAGTKTARIRWSGSGGTILVGQANSTVTRLWARAQIANMLTNAQTYYWHLVDGTPTWLTNLNNTAVDTTAATSVVYSMQLNTATDWQIMSWCRVRLDRSS